MKHLFHLIIFVLISTFAQAQEPNQALNFDGVDDYISFTNSVDIANQNFTIHFWAKKDIGSGAGYVVTKGENFTTNNFLHIGWADDTTIKFDFWNNELLATVVDDGLWHHWSFNYGLDNDGVKKRCILRDGIVIAIDIPGSDFTGTQKLEIGRAGLSSLNYFKGTLDQVALLYSYFPPQTANPAALNCEIADFPAHDIYHFNDDPTTATLQDFESKQGSNNGVLQNFALTGTISNWTYDAPFVTPHLSGVMANQTVIIGETLVLNPNFVESQCIHMAHEYRWYHNGVYFFNGYSPTLTIENFNAPGTYRCEIEVWNYTYNDDDPLKTIITEATVDVTMLDASVNTSDYFIDVAWGLPISPCLLDANGAQYTEVTVQLLKDGNQIEFQTIEGDELANIYADPNGAINGEYRDLVGPDQAHEYTINVFVGPFGNIDVDCFGLTASGSTSSKIDPYFLLESDFEKIYVTITSLSDLATSYEILRDGQVIETITGITSDTTLVFNDNYEYDNGSSIVSGQEYNYQLRMVSSFTNQTFDYDMGLASTTDIEPLITGSPNNTEKIDITWNNNIPSSIDKVEIWREGLLSGVKQTNSPFYMDFAPYFGDSTNYNIRLIREDTVRADFNIKGYLEGNGGLAGRIITNLGQFPVSGVNVKITRESTQDTFVTMTNVSGQFEFTELAYGLLDSFELQASLSGHTFSYPIPTLGISTLSRNIDNALILDDFEYTEVSSVHTVTSFTATLVPDSDLVTLDWALTTSVTDDLFIDVIRNGDIIFSSTDLDDLNNSFDDLGGTPNEETKYEIRIYDISGNTVSSAEEEIEVIFPDVAHIPTFTAIEEQNNNSGTGNVQLDFTHTSSNFDKFRIYRNDSLLVELDNTADQYIDDSAPFGSDLVYMISATRELNNTTYETTNPTVANPSPINLGVMPAPAGILVVAQPNTPSIKINFGPPSNIGDFEYTGFLIYRNDVLIHTFYKTFPNNIFYDTRAAGMTDIEYSVSLFKHTENGIIESDRSSAALIDFPLAAVVPTLSGQIIPSGEVLLTWAYPANSITSNVSGYMIEHNDEEIIRVPAIVKGYLHYPGTEGNQEYKLYSYNTRDNVDYISTVYTDISIVTASNQGVVYPPQNFTASQELGNHVKLCWEYLDFIPSEFIISKFGDILDTLPIGTKSYYDYSTPTSILGSPYKIQAIQAGQVSSFAGAYGKRVDHRLIFGTLTDPVTMEGIPNAAIELDDPYNPEILYAYTDSSGYYSFLITEIEEGANYNMKAIVRVGGSSTAYANQTFMGTSDGDIRVDFTYDIPDRPDMGSLANIEYANVDTNPYTLHGNIHWRVNNDNFTGVEVYRGFDLMAILPKTESNIYMDTSAVPGIQYPYLLRTYLETPTGVEYSPMFEIGRIYPAVAPVINLTATPQIETNQVLLQWSHFYEHADGYLVSINGVPVAQVAETSSFMFYDSLGTAGEEYTYTVNAYKVIDDELSLSEDAIVSAIFPAAAPVINLQLTIPTENTQSLNHVLISWDYETNGVHSYKVYRDDELIITLPADSTSYADYNSIPDAANTYSIKAVINQNGILNESEDASGTINLPAISKIYEAMLTDLEDEGAKKMTWLHSDHGIDGFKFLRILITNGVSDTATYNVSMNSLGNHEFVDFEGVPGVQYDNYRVVAHSKRNGIDYYSDTNGFSNETYPYPPTPVLSASEGLYDQAIELTWDLSPDAGIDALELIRTKDGIEVRDTFTKDTREYLDVFDTYESDGIYYTLRSCKDVGDELICYGLEPDGITQLNNDYTALGSLKEQDSAYFSGPSTGSSFGRSVDVDGEWMIVGDYDNQSVTFFKMVGDEWIPNDTITASQIGVINLGLGFSVAISGGLAVAGIPSTNIIGCVTFKLVDGHWEHEASLPSVSTSQLSGFYVDIDGDYIIYNNISATTYQDFDSSIIVYKRASTCGDNVLCYDDYTEIDINEASGPATFKPNSATSVKIDGDDIFIGFGNAIYNATTNLGLVVAYKLDETEGEINPLSAYSPSDSNSRRFGRIVDYENGKIAVATDDVVDGYSVNIYELDNNNSFIQLQHIGLGDSGDGAKDISFVDDLLLISQRATQTSFSSGDKVYLYREGVNSNFFLIQSPNIGDDNYREELYDDPTSDPQVYSYDFGYAVALTPTQIFIGDPNFQETYFNPGLDPSVHILNIYEPENTAFTASKGTLLNTRLTWSSVCAECPADYIDGFNIYRDSVLIGNVGANSTQFTDSPTNIINGVAVAQAGIIYTYEIEIVSGVFTSDRVADDGYAKSKGKISGNVNIFGTNTGVSGVTIEMSGADNTTNNPYIYSTVSLSDGSYTIDNMFIPEDVQGIEYYIEASNSDGNDFEVFNGDVRVLTSSDPEELSVLISDNTSFAVRGQVKNSISSCGAENVYVKYYHTFNGIETIADSVKTGNDGLYSIIIKPNISDLQSIRISVDDKSIIENEATGMSDIIHYAFASPDSVITNFNSIDTVTTINFEESLIYPLTVRVQNVCSLPIADQEVNFRVSSVDGCIEQIYQTDIYGIAEIHLPPNNYLFSVESLEGSGITNYENAAIDYLKLRQFNFDLSAIHAAEATADTLPIIDPILFEYHRAPLFALTTSFDRYQCDDTSNPAIITQGSEHTIDVIVSESHQSEICEVAGGYIRILNPASSTPTADTLFSIGGSFEPYTFSAGGPNLVAPHAYGISMQYFSDDGNFLGQKIISAIVEGQRQLPGTGVITEAGEDEAGNLLMPLLVLRDPPGDGSYSSIESGTTISKTLEVNDESSGSAGLLLESEFTFAGFGFFSDLNTGAGGGMSSTSNFDFSITTTDTYSTSDSEDAVGRGADIIVGTGLSQQYGLSTSLVFENNCDPIVETELAFGTGGFSSTYSYTIDFIEGLIESYIQDSIRLESGTLTYVKPDGSDYTLKQSRARVHALITAWKEMIHYHDVETVPHYVLCSDFSYREGEITDDAQDIYDDWRNGFCNLIGSYQGDKFIMDDEIDWTPGLINAYNNTIAFTNELKDPLAFIDDGDLNFTAGDFQNNDKSVTAEYHNTLGNEIKSAEVFDVSGNVSLDKTITARYHSSTAKAFTRFFFLDFAGGLAGSDESSVGLGVTTKLTELTLNLGASITAEASINVSRSQAIENESTISYHIFDDDAEDQVTFIALQAPLQDQTPYFIRLGGLSSCPAEEALTISQDNAPLKIDSFNISVVIDPINGATSNIPPPIYNVDPEEAAIYEVKINSLGPTGLSRDAEIFLDLASNPFGAIIKIGGSNLNIVSPQFSIPAGGTVTQFLTIERPPNAPSYNFEGLRIGVRPACGGQEQFIELDVYFDNPCSDVSLTMPLNHYIVNRINPNIDDDREIIPFEMRDYDSGATSQLAHIQLQYRRLGNNSGWQSVPEGRFTKSVLANNDAELAAGQDPLYFFEWDITGQYNLLPDGYYLVRALSFCGTSGINYSNEVDVEILRSPLLVTGYPQPSDGIWTAGDEISTTYSTDIDCDLLNVIDSIGDYLKLVDLTTMMEVPFDFVCQNNKLTIVPIEDMGTYDNHTLRVTYTGIFNLQENIAEDVVWDFRVITHDLDWTEEVIEITLFESEIQTYSTSIFNTTNTLITNVSITGGSNLSWLTLDPSTTFNVPNDGIFIDLNFDGNVGPGDYMTTLELSSDNTPDVVVLLHVLPDPPFPDVNTDFTDSMQLVLNWSFTDPYATSTNTSDAIYIYKDGQLRGGGAIVAEGNFYYAKITVYGNADEEGELLDFVVWNSGLNTAYSAIETLEIPFEANENRGLISNPEIILIDNDLFDITKQLYVDHTNTSGTENGSSWETAYSDLQDAITNANDGDEIWIAKGTYSPTSTGDRTVSYVFENAITVYGGFANANGLPADQVDDISDRTGSDETILSGDLLTPAITDNSYHVVENTSNGLILNMLTVADGNADGTDTDDKGGCLFNTGIISLQNCKMTNGKATTNGGLLYNSGQMIIDGGTYEIPAVSTISNLYNDTGAMITVRQTVSIVKE